jgi:tetratricopeptide (TPR) repeat protein
MNENKYQDFLIKLQNADESEREWLVMEFSLQNLSEILRQAVWAAAIPHWFNHEFLNAILGFPLKDSDFKTLTELSFVEVFPERGFNVHERSRKLLLDKLWSTNKARFQKLSKQAAAYCKKQDQDVTHWRVETLYHGLLANGLTAKDEFIEQTSDWYSRFQFDKLEILTKVVLDAVDSRFISGEVSAWAAFLQAQVDILYDRYLSAQNLLQQALKQSVNKHLIAEFTRTMGNTHKLLSEYSEARNCYQQALQLFQKIKNDSGKATCIQALGEIHSIFAEYDLAKNCYQQALSSHRQIKDDLNEAFCIRGLGGIYHSLAEHNQAIDYYQQALEIYKRLEDHLDEANCIKNLGDVYFNLTEYDVAQNSYQQSLLIYQQIKDRLGIADCTRALGLLHGVQQQISLAIIGQQQAAEIYRTIGSKSNEAICFNNIAVFHHQQKQFEPALIAFNQAIEIFPDTNWYQNRASLYMAMENYEKAAADIKQAESMGKNLAGTLLRKAELALWQQQTQQSVEFSQQALAQRPADGNFRAFFALTLLVNGQTEQANNEMQQALTAIYQQHDFDSLLEDLDKLIRIYGERLEFAQLRELICKHPHFKTL